MFTGIIETTGTVDVVDDRPGGRRLRIRSPAVATDAAVGDSIAIDGVCLTVEADDGEAVEVFLAAETVDRTTLGEIEVGAAVNIERPMPADGRFDGHLVQGHVDGTTEIVGIESVGEDWRFSFAIPEGLGKYIVEKGSIALDGISLTVAARSSDSFDVAIIPETYDRTVLSEKNVCDRVHVEVDVIAKYVESLLEST